MSGEQRLDSRIQELERYLRGQDPKKIDIIAAAEPNETLIAIRIIDAAIKLGLPATKEECLNEAKRVKNAVQEVKERKITFTFRDPESLNLQPGEAVFYLHASNGNGATVSLGIVEEPSPLRLKTLPVLHITRNHIRVYVGNYREVEPTIYYPDPKEVSITRFTGNVSTWSMIKQEAA